MPPRRKCIPNVHRDAYITSRRTSGLSEVNVRVTERYVDDFLRYCEKQFGFSDAIHIAPKHITAYAKLQNKTRVMKGTIRTKVREVLNWCEWLVDEGFLERNPASDLNVTDLVP